MKAIAKIIACLALCVILTPHLFAGTYALPPQTTDGSVNGLNAIDTVTGTAGRVGLSTSNGYGRAAVFAFSVPKLPFGESITAASLNLNLASTTGTFTFNGDLTSLGISASPSVLGTDYFNGTYGADPDATLIQQHFLTPSTALGHVVASSSGTAAIAADLERYRAAGATGGSFYFLRLNPDFTTLSNAVAGYNVSMTEDVAANQPSLSAQTTPPPQMGRVLFEYWTGLDTSGTVGSLTNTALNTNYPNLPTAREYSTVMEIPQNMDTYSGDRMRCYFYPPVTGYYTFAIASDDNSSLLFSTNGNPANATQIASVTNLTAYQQWSAYASQTSSPLYLTAGQTCYMESLHKQATGSSNLSIGWKPPTGVVGSGTMGLMPATYCAPYDAGVSYTNGVISNYVRAFNHPRLMISPAAIARLANQVTVGTTQYNAVQAANWATIKSVVTGTASSGTPSGGGTLYGPLIGSAVIVAPTTGVAGNDLILVGRSLQDRVYYLALFYLLESKLNPSDTKIQGALDQIYAELTSAAQWGSTNNASTPGNWAIYQFLDLPEICHAFAIAYDWCYAGWSSTQRSAILGWIVNQGLIPGISAYGNGTTTAQSWVNGSNNWTEVCDGGLAFCALSVLNDETTTPKATTILNDMIPALTKAPAMAAWGPDGGWAEGSAYWGFASRYVTGFFACLETSAATCFNIDKLSGVSSIGSFGFYQVGPTNNVFNYSDAGTGSYLGPWTQYYGLKYNQPMYSYAESQSGHYPLDVIWYDTRLVKPGATTPTSTYYDTAGAIFLRSAWNDANALYAGMKAGFNANVTPFGSGHQDEEIGSFVFDALNVRWIQDLGNDNYGLAGYFTTSPWSTSNRWQLYRKRAEGNNTLVINPSLDGGQSSYGTATVTDFETGPNLQQAIIDMTGAYSKTDGNPTNKVSSATPVASLKRGFRILNGAAQIQDEIVTSATTLVSNPTVWQYEGTSVQTGTFTATFDATSAGAPTNAIIGLSSGTQSAYTGYACIARFNPTGNLDARDGAAYNAASTIPYLANTTYHWRMVVNVATDTYSVYVTPAGGSEQLVGLNYGFRSEQATLASLNEAGSYVDVSGSGSLTVANLQINGQAQGAATVDLNWFAHTSKTISINNTANPPTATLTSGTKNLLLTLQSPAGAQFKTMAAKPLPSSPDYEAFSVTPPSNGESANSGVNKLWIEFAQSGSSTLTVGFSPYITGSTPPAPPAVLPLSSWPARAVIPTPSFTQWENNYFTSTQMGNSAISGGTATPQNDKVSNLLKYLNGSDPSRPMAATDRAALPTVSMTATNGNPCFVMNYRQNPLASGITVNVQTSSDLKAWTTVTPSSIQQVSTDATTGNPIMQVQVPITTGTPKQFLRLNVTQP